MYSGVCFRYTFEHGVHSSSGKKLVYTADNSDYVIVQTQLFDDLWSGVKKTVKDKLVQGVWKLVLEVRNKKTGLSASMLIIKFSRRNHVQFYSQTLVHLFVLGETGHKEAKQIKHSQHS